MNETTPPVPSSPNDSENNAFYKLGGVIHRGPFFVNMVILAALFGCSFGLILLGTDAVYKQNLEYSFFQMFVWCLVAGSICGIFGLMILGLGCILVGIFWAHILLIGSLVNVSKINIYELHTGLSTLATGLLMTCVLIFAYGNVTKRVRSIVQDAKYTHLWSVLAFLLSTVPFVGTVIFYVLTFYPSKSNRSS